MLGLCRNSADLQSKLQSVPIAKAGQVRASPSLSLGWEHVLGAAASAFPEPFHLNTVQSLK